MRSDNNNQVSTESSSYQTLGSEDQAMSTSEGGNSSYEGSGQGAGRAGKVLMHWKV